MYEFVRGPLLWAAFIIFFVGLVYRVVSLVMLSRKKDGPFYDHFDAGWSLRSILHWILPLNVTAKQYPVYTLIGFVFHILLLGIPIFLLAHAVLWRESWGIRWWSLNESFADYLTMLMIASVLFMALRRIVAPYARIVTTPIDYFLLLVAGLPFMTGLIAYHQWGDYRLMVTLHILAGELMLILIPFTKLSHMVLFFFSRAVIGSEFGARRGTKTW